jgi:hypothetical protein
MLFRRLALGLFVLCLAGVPVVLAQEPPVEIPVQIIQLDGPASQPEAEISGLAWYGDTLILMPENPNLYATADAAGMLFALPKAEVVAYLDASDPAPLTPALIPLIAPDIPATIPGFDGFEAITFVGDRVFLTVEIRLSEGMRGAIVSGTVAPDLSAITLDLDHPVELLPQADIDNLSYESLLPVGDQLVAIYEANGAGVNPQPYAYEVDQALTQTTTTIPFPNIEYRITDATPPDENGVFWAINYFFPGDTKLEAAVDTLVETYGQGATHRTMPGVERLVAFQVGEEGITRVDQPPIQLLLTTALSRNWEGIARLEDRGFLLVTDRWPVTTFAFVPVEGMP